LGGSSLLLPNDVVAQVNAVGAYGHAAGAFDYRAHVITGSVAEAADGNRALLAASALAAAAAAAAAAAFLAPSRTLNY
jgi:hypothetical protein